MKSGTPQCAKCPVVRCHPVDRDKKLPEFCPTRTYPDISRESIERHKNDPYVRGIDLAWVELMSKVQQDWYSWTRLDEIIEYARIRGVKKIGIATCVGLLTEAKLLTRVLEGHDFQVVSVCCLAGEVSPGDVDIVREGIFCNPIMQAEVLNREGTGLNVMLGLCLGHDILFTRYSEADVTTLIVKDRALGHNPAVALYLTESYYRNRFKKKD